MSGIDWYQTWRPALLAWLAGGDPYSVPTFYGPPWALLPMAPLALLPPAWGRWALFALSLAGLAAAARYAGHGRAGVVLLLLSPPAVHGLLNANIDWLPLLALGMPRPVGLLFLAAKPQIGAGVAAYWLIEAIWRGGLNGLIDTAGPLALALIWSLAAFGPWPLRMMAAPGAWFNAAPAVLLGPGVALAIAAGLLLLAVRSGRVRWALPAGPIAAPYLLFHSWVGVLAALPVGLLALADVGLWWVVLR